MRTSDLERLEFHKIKDLLKELCHSEATREAVDSLRPLTDPQEVKRAIDTIKAFEKVQLTLYEFEDIRDLLKRSKVEGAVLGAEDLLKIFKVLKLIRNIRRSIGSVAERDERLRPLSKKLHLFSSLESLIERTIDQRGYVKDSASEDLSRIRKSIRSLEKEVMSRLESLFNRPDADKIFSDKIVTLRNGRYVVPVKTSQVRKIFGIVHGTSSSGYTTYLEPQFVVQINNRIAELKGEEEVEVRRVLQRITSHVGSQAQKILESFNALVEVDLLNAKRELGKRFDGTFPKLGDKIDLKGVKHPLLALSAREVVPVDISFQDRKGVLLTGPNTGGKTVALKSLGLIVLMVQSGIPVPVNEGSTLKVFKKVFVDVGDEQSIEQNLSTFSSHMRNISEFLKETDEESLVLLDELGAGTDPSEGSALAIGILEFLKNRGSWVFANTHHTPVKAYAVSSDYFLPATVLFDRNSLQPLYRIAYGIVGESMALEVAIKVGVPEEVIKVARDFLKGSFEEYTDLAKKLSDYAHDYQKKVEEIEVLKRSLQEEKAKVENLKKELEDQKRRSWKEVKKEAKAFLNKIMREAQEMLKSEEGRKRIEDFVKEKEKQLELFAPEEEKKEPISEGDTVEFMKKTGKVLKIKGERAQVVLEGMRMWVRLKDLKKVKSKPTAVEIPQKSAPSLKIKKEINVVGMDTESALLEVERFLEEAYASGEPSVKIIHGIGKGILKKAIRDLLSNHPKVRFYRDGYPKEGGSGVTVVFLEENSEN